MKKTYDKEKIQGISIEIDVDVSNNCKMANESSALSRKVLYILIFTSVLAFIALWNSRSNGWSVLKHKELKEKRQNIINDIQNTDSLIKYCNQNCNLDSLQKVKELISINKNKETLKYKLATINIYFDKSVKNYMDNIGRIHIPVFGTSTDINDLGIVSGLSFSIMLFIMLFTMQREYINHKIAFISISERYTDYADFDIFSKCFEQEQKNQYNIQKTDSIEHKESIQEKAEDIILTETEKLGYILHINKIRRRYHYLQLSMNEIYSMPIINIREDTLSIRRLFLKLIYLPPIIIQYIIFINDFMTKEAGLDVNISATFSTQILETIFLVSITFFTVHILRKDFLFNKLWDDFSNNNYKLQFNREKSYDVSYS